MILKHTTAVFFVVITMLAGTQAAAEGRTLPGQPLDNPLSVFGGFQAINGTGVERSSEEDAGFVLLEIDLGLSWNITKALKLSASLGVSKFVIEPKGANDPDFIGHDLILSFDAIPLVVDTEYTGLALTAGIDVRLPTTEFTKAEQLYTAVTPRVSVLKPVGWALLGYTLAVHNNFHENTGLVSSPDAASNPFEDVRNPFAIAVLTRNCGIETYCAGLIQTGFQKTSFAFQNTLGAVLTPWPRYQADLSLGLTTAISYDTGIVSLLPGEEVSAGRDTRTMGNARASLRFLWHGESFLDQRTVIHLTLTAAEVPFLIDSQDSSVPFFGEGRGDAVTAAALGVELVY